MLSNKELFKIFLIVLRDYFKANKRLKSNIDSYDYLEQLSKEIIKKLDYEIEIINNSDHDFNDGSFLIANHQDNLDIIALIASSLCKIKFVAKKELFTMPFLNKYIKLSKSLSLDRSDPRSGVSVFKDALKQVEDNNNIVIFPEGTRNTSNILLDFNSGLFNIIRKTSKAIIPVYIKYQNKKVSIILQKKIFINDKIKGTDLCNKVFDDILNLKKYYSSNKKINLLAIGDSITYGDNAYNEYHGGYYQIVSDRLNKEGLLLSSTNKAVSGIRINDLEKMIASNENRILDSIKECDYLFLTIGANDILDVVKKGKLSKESIKEEFVNVSSKTSKLIKYLISINNKMNVILVGLYFCYPHSKVFAKFNMMDLFDKYYQDIENSFSNVKQISIYQDIYDNKDKYLPNKRNIHLSDEGYEYVAKEIIKELRKIV